MSPSCSDSLSRGCIVLYIDAAPFNWRRLYCSAARHIRANDCWCPRQMNRSRELWAIAPNTHERVRNARTALTLKVRVGTRGYEYVLLCLPECRAVYRTVHRLMAQAFLHNSDPQTCGTVDHIDGDLLNNTVGNLRWASRGLQSHNARKRRGCISRYRGVTTHIAIRTSERPWIASIWKDRVCYPLGRFATQEEAAACYNDAAVRLYGACCARLNSLPASQT